MNAAMAGFAAMLTLALGACAPHADSQSTGTNASTRVQRTSEAFAYPGAAPMAPATFVTADSGVVRTIAGFTTTDAFEKVYDYYRRQLPPKAETMHVISANGSVATFSMAGPGTAETIAVQISSDKPNETEILITRRRR